MPLKGPLRWAVSILLCATATGAAEGDRSARIEDGWIIASQGRDESLQTVKVQIWGPENIKGEFLQVDADPEMEYVVVSRGLGTGPYYKLQIIDFRPNGIVVWAYDSSGSPRVRDGRVSLGWMPDGYLGAGTGAVYRDYRLTDGGLEPVQ